MSLNKVNFRDVPADGIVLSEEDALIYQMKIITKWKNGWDTLGFRYAGIGLAAAGAFTGIYLNNHYRRKLNLRNIGKISTYLPICVLPSILSYGIHAQVILPDLLLRKSCPVCIESRGAALQATFGFLLPALLAPLSSFAVANRYLTYDIPYIHKEPIKVLKLYQKMTKPVGNILFAIFLGNALLGSAVTYLEAKSVQKVNKKLLELEYNLEHGIEFDTK